MKYFSIDYRSCPSGLGQIVNSKSANPYSYILVTYPGCGLPDDPNYSHTFHIDTPEVREAEWIGPAIPFLHQILKSAGVTEVYDSELGCEHPDKCNRLLHFKLQDWIDIIKSC